MNCALENTIQSILNRSKRTIELGSSNLRTRAAQACLALSAVIAASQRLDAATVQRTSSSNAACERTAYALPLATYAAQTNAPWSFASIRHVQDSRPLQTYGTGIAEESYENETLDRKMLHVADWVGLGALAGAAAIALSIKQRSNTGKAADKLSMALELYVAPGAKYTVPQICSHAGISKSTLYKAIKERGILTRRERSAVIREVRQTYAYSHRDECTRTLSEALCVTPRTVCLYKKAGEALYAQGEALYAQRAGSPA